MGRGKLSLQAILEANSMALVKEAMCIDELYTPLLLLKSNQWRVSREQLHDTDAPDLAVTTQP